MSYREWRVGRFGAESVPADRLTPDRLAGFLSLLRSVSPESSEESPPVEASEQLPATGSSASAEAQDEEPASSATGARPQSAELRAADSPPAAQLPKSAPTLAVFSVAGVAAAPTVVHAPPAKTDAATPQKATPAARAATEPSAVAPAAVEPAVLEPAVLEPAGVERNSARPTDSKKGRHRPPSSAHFGISGIAFTTRRLAILGALAVVVAAAVVLALI